MEKIGKPRFRHNEWVLLAVLFCALVVVSTGLQMGNALFPGLSRLMNVPLETVTLLVSVWAFTGLLAPLFGPLSDRYGHGTFLLIGLGTYTLGILLCAFAPTFPVLVGLQVLVGLGYAIFGFSVSAFMGDVFAYEVRARAMGIVRVAVSVTALAGVPVAAFIADRATARASFAAVGGLGIIVLAFVCILVPRLSRQKQVNRPTQVRNETWRTVLQIARQRPVIIALLAYMVFAMIPTSVFIYIAAWLEQTFQLAETQVGLAMSTVGVGALIGNALTAALVDRLGKKRSSVFGLIALAVAAIGLPRLPSLVTVLLGFGLLAIALEFTAGAYGTLMTELTPASRGTLMSLCSLANGIGTGLTPLLMRPLWEKGGFATITLIMGTVGLGSAALVALFVGERQTAGPTLGDESAPI